MSNEERGKIRPPKLYLYSNRVPKDGFHILIFDHASKKFAAPDTRRGELKISQYPPPSSRLTADKKGTT